MTGKRQAAEARGRRAETLTAIWLMAKGYRILARRARTPYGELDLVAKRGPVLAFVEVKTSDKQGRAVHALSPRQQGRLIRAGAWFRSRSDEFARLQPRFDLMIIEPGRWPEHRRGAWQAEGRDALDLN
ncbi:YraN family protein [Hyphobacterium marinum]|uniref:UPF0102 protein V0U35_01910 n=1 Tax=Hyphobacterium marinum TaxID=3116574 RepID=A0ABU7LW58_9PROT|nr:YraN family protein [Hyphobacterium sp. Y6023]MEE2565420.1 YraN family protein [Hyphobacterium sp. Y6023]